MIKYNLYTTTVPVLIVCGLQAVGAVEQNKQLQNLRQYTTKCII